jgi:hypothetical protein
MLRWLRPSTFRQFILSCNPSVLKPNVRFGTDDSSSLSSPGRDGLGREWYSPGKLARGGSTDTLRRLSPEKHEHSGIVILVQQG